MHLFKGLLVSAHCGKESSHFWEYSCPYLGHGCDLIISIATENFTRCGTSSENNFYNAGVSITPSTLFIASAACVRQRFTYFITLV